MSTDRCDQKRTALFQRVPSRDISRAVFRFPYEDDFAYSLAYMDAAHRLASTHQGEARDDRILMPLLMLCRHAFELQLKELVRMLTRHRRHFGHHGVISLEDLELHLKKKVRHNLSKVHSLARTHWEELGLGAFPAEVNRAVQLLHEADPEGLSFRYTRFLRDTSGSTAGESGRRAEYQRYLPERQESVDLPNLMALLSNGFETLGGAFDYAHETLRYVPGDV